MFTPGPDNDTQTNTGQNTTSKTESGTQSGGSGGVKFPRLRNELMAIPPTTDISSHCRTSRTVNRLTPKLVESLSHSRRCRLFYARFPQEFRSLFRRRGIDVETGAPLESCRLGQLGHAFDVPVIVVVDRILGGRAVDDQVIRRIVQHPIRLVQQRPNRLSQVLVHMR